MDHDKRVFLTLAFIAAVFVSFGTVACQANPQGIQIAAAGTLHVWLDQPPDGAGLPLAPFTLRAHARDAGSGGVERIVFLVNTIPLATIATDPTQPLVTAEFTWNPAVAGEYRIQALASNRNGSALSAVAVVCVGPGCGGTSETGTTPTPTPTAPSTTGQCRGTPVISAFSAAPTSISAGASSTLSWATSNADTIQIITIGDVPATGSRSVSPTTTTTYTIYAFCGGKENYVERSVTVTVTGATTCSGRPTISAFTASPASITAGAASSLQWTVTNADRVEMVGVGEVAISGSRSVSPRTTTTYNLVAYCQTKESYVERTVTVNVVAAATPSRTATRPPLTPTRTPTTPSQPPPPQPPPGCTGTPNIASFTASPTTINAGGSSTLSWGAVTNADSVSIDQGIGGVGTPGSTSVSPGGTTTYTLTARCSGTVATRQVTINVTSAPPPQDTQGPSISGVGYTAKSLYYNNTGCGPTSLTVTANVTDPSGIKSVQVTYRYLPSKGGASNPTGVQMNSTGGNGYGATIDVRTSAYGPLNGGNGQFEFWIVAVDGYGNSSQISPIDIPIANCPG